MTVHRLSSENQTVAVQGEDLKNTTWNGEWARCTNFGTTVEPLYNGHHWEQTFCSLQQSFPSSGTSVYFLIKLWAQCGCVFRAFPCFVLAGSAKQRLLLRVNSSSNGGQSCSVSAKLGWLMIVRIQLGVWNCSLYGVAGCPLFRGCLSTEVNGRTVWTFRSARYIMGTIEGCLLSGAHCNILKFTHHIIYLMVCLTLS